MAAKKASKGKRYTQEEKQSVIDFVNNHNAEKGRGGITAAAKKFGASALTISSWLKSAPAGGKTAKASAGRSAAFADGKRSKVLGELYKLDQEISSRRAELKTLEAKFEKLKAAL